MCNISVSNSLRLFLIFPCYFKNVFKLHLNTKMGFQKLEMLPYFSFSFQSQIILHYLVVVRQSFNDTEKIKFNPIRCDCCRSTLNVVFKVQFQFLGDIQFIEKQYVDKTKLYHLRDCETQRSKMKNVLFTAYQNLNTPWVRLSRCE